MAKKWNNHISFLIGLIIILLSFFLAVFAYFIIPDKTKNANDQIPELALKAPGHSALFYKKRIKELDGNNWSKWITGQNIEYQLQSIAAWKIDSDKLVLINDAGFEQEIDFEELSDGYDDINEEYIESELIAKRKFLFGTDKFGRDIFSRLILGLRISLLVGLVAVIISIIVGLFFGLISGYFGGRVDQFILYLINTFWSIPTILLVFAIVVGFGRNIVVIFIAVGLTMWVDVARIVRAQVLTEKEKTFVAAARSIGMKNSDIIIRHVLPNIMAPVFVIAAANFAIAILIEAGLSYLGFGVQPPIPSLGNMLNENYGFALSGKVYMAVIPAILIMLLVLAFNLAGNGLRDIFDVKD